MNKKEMKMEIERLKKELFKAKTQLNIYNYEMALTNLKKCSKEKLMGSGVVLSLKTLDGKNIIEDICIEDGLSKETTEALEKDILETVNNSIGFKFFAKKLLKNEE